MENATILLVFGQTIIHIDVFIHGIPFLSGIEIMDFHHEKGWKTSLTDMIQGHFCPLFSNRRLRRFGAGFDLQSKHDFFESAVIYTAISELYSVK